MSTCEQHMTKLSHHIAAYIRIFKYIYIYIYRLNIYIYICIYCIYGIGILKATLIPWFSFKQIHEAAWGALRWGRGCPMSPGETIAGRMHRWNHSWSMVVSRSLNRWYFSCQLGDYISYTYINLIKGTRGNFMKNGDYVIWTSLKINDFLFVCSEGSGPNSRNLLYTIFFHMNSSRVKD